MEIIEQLKENFDVVILVSWTHGNIRHLKNLLEQQYNYLLSDQNSYPDFENNNIYIGYSGHILDDLINNQKLTEDGNVYDIVVDVIKPERLSIKAITNETLREMKRFPIIYFIDDDPKDSIAAEIFYQIFDKHKINYGADVQFFYLDDKLFIGYFDISLDDYNLSNIITTNLGDNNIRWVKSSVTQIIKLLHGEIAISINPIRTSDDIPDFTSFLEIHKKGLEIKEINRKQHTFIIDVFDELFYNPDYIGKITYGDTIRFFTVNNVLHIGFINIHISDNNRTLFDTVVEILDKNNLKWMFSNWYYMAKLLYGNATKRQIFNKNIDPTTKFSNYLVFAHGGVDETTRKIKLSSGIRVIMMCTNTMCPSSKEHDALLFSYGTENIKPDLANIEWLSTNKRKEYNMCVYSGNINEKFVNAFETFGCVNKNRCRMLDLKYANYVPNVTFSGDEQNRFRAGLFQSPISIENVRDRNSAIEQLIDPNKMLNITSFYTNSFENDIMDLETVINLLKKREEYDHSKCVITLLVAACIGSSWDLVTEEMRCMIDLPKYINNVVSYIDNDTMYLGVTFGNYDAVIANTNKQQIGGSNKNIYYQKYKKYKNKYLALSMEYPNIMKIG